MIPDHGFVGEATVSSKGMVSIPKATQDFWDIREGDKLKFFPQGMAHQISTDDALILVIEKQGRKK